MNIFKTMWSKFLSLKKWQKFVVALLLLSVLGAIGGSGESSSESNSTKDTQTEAVTKAPLTTLEKLDEYSVKWENYSPTVKQRLADLIDAGDCSNLQIEFDNADRNSEATGSRTGESNANLMTLIDDQMKKLGCY